MHDTFSIACRSEPYSAFPYRRRPKTGKRSLSLQRKSHLRALVDLIAWRHSLRPSARLIVVITHLMCLITASTFLESRAGAQIAPRPQSIDRFFKFIGEASTRFTVPAPPATVTAPVNPESCL